MFHKGRIGKKGNIRVMFWIRAVFLSQGILVIPACPTKGCPQGMSHVKRLGSLDYGVLPTRRSDERDFGDLCVPHKGCPTRDESQGGVTKEILAISVCPIRDAPQGRSHEEE